MPSKNVEMGIRFTADGKGFVGEVKISREALDNLGKTGKQAGEEVAKGAKQATSEAERMNDSLKRMGHYGAGLLGLNLGASLARDIVHAADAMTNLQSRLRLVTDSTVALGAAQQEVIRIAQATRQSLESTGDVYFKMAKGGEALGLSQAHVARLTETISQAMTLSGSSAESARAALMQFGQALSSGVLRGEELNSVMEQAPALAEAIAKGMGKSVGELRRLGEAGELTVQQIIEALNKSAPEVARQFGLMTPTVGGAFQQLSNSAKVFIGEIDRASGASTGLASSIHFVAENLNSFAAVAGVTASVGLGGLVGGMAKSAQAARALAAEQAALSVTTTSLNAALGMKAAATTGATTAMIGARAVMGAMGGPIGLIITALSLGATAWALFGNSAEDAAQKSANALAKLRRDALERGKDEKSAVEEHLAGLKKRIDAGFTEYGKATSPGEKSVIWKKYGLGNLSDERVAAQAELDKIIEREKNLAAKLAGISTSEAWNKLYMTPVEKKNHAIKELNKGYAKELATLTGNEGKTLQVVAEYHAKRARLEEEFKPKAAAKAKESDFAKFTQEATQREALLKAEAEGLAHLTATEAWAVKIEAELTAGKLKMTPADQAQTRATLERIKAGDAANRIAEEERKTREHSLKELESGTEAIKKQIEATLYETSIIGKTKEEIAMLQSQRGDHTISIMEEQLATLEAVKSGTAETEALREQIAVRKELKAVTEAKATGEASEAGVQAAKKANKEMAKDFKKTVDEYDDVFRKGFADMVNGGTGTWKAWTKSLTTTFKTTVADEIYKMFAQPFVVRFVASMLGVTGGASGMANAADGTNYLGMASNASGANSLYGYASGAYQNTLAYGAYGTSAANVVGGNMVISGSAQEAALAQQWAGGGYSASPGAAGSMAAYGGAAAGAYYGYQQHGIGGAAVYGTVGYVGGAALAGGAAAAGGGMAAAGAGAMGGASAALAAIPVWGWVALAALAIFGWDSQGKGPALRTGNWTGGLGEDTKSTDNHWFSDDAMGADLAKWSDSMQASEQAIIKNLGMSEEQIQKANENIAALAGKQYGFGMEDGDWLTTGPAAMAQIARDRMQGIADAVGISLNQLFLEVTFDITKKADQYTKLFGESVDTAAIEGSAIEVNGVAESVVQTFVRLTSIFGATGAVTTMLGVDAATAFGAVGLTSTAMRQSLIDGAGGMAAFQDQTASFFTNFYTSAEQGKLTGAAATDKLNADFAAIGLTAPTTHLQFRNLAASMLDGTEAGNQAYQSVMKLSGSFVAVHGTAQAAAEALAKTQGLQAQILDLTGHHVEAVAMQRKIELSSLSATDTQLQLRIYALQDEAEAVAKVNSILSQKFDLEIQYASLTGDNTLSRTKELQAIDPSNRALQIRIWALQDEQAAADQSAQSAQNVASAYQDAYKAQQDYLTGLVDFGKSVKDFLLGLSTGVNASTSPESRLAATRDQYLADLSGSRNGDTEAYARLTKSAQDYIDAGQAYNASGAAQQARIAQIKSEMGGLDPVTQYDANVAALHAIEAAINLVNASTQSSGASISSAVHAIPFAITAANLQLLDTLDVKFGLLDTDLSNGLSITEFRAGMAGKASDAAINALFNLTDTNHDGIITVLEAGNASSNNFTAAIANLEALITVGAYAPMTAAQFSARFTGTATDATLTAWFSQLDTNGDGMLTALEISNANTGSTKYTMEQYAAMDNHMLYDLTLYANGERNQLNTIISLLAGTLTVRSSNQSGTPMMFANGGVFDSGIVTRPTMFSMGMMGEAGPEAIMPLTRINGRLGVASTGGNNDDKASVAELKEVKELLRVIAAKPSSDAAVVAAVARLEKRMAAIEDQGRLARAGS